MDGGIHVTVNVILLEVADGYNNGEIMGIIEPMHETFRKPLP